MDDLQSRSMLIFVGLSADWQQPILSQEVVQCGGSLLLRPAQPPGVSLRSGDLVGPTEHVVTVGRLLLALIGGRSSEVATSTHTGS